MNRLTILSLSLFLLSDLVSAQETLVGKSLDGLSASVACANPLAAEVGANILRDGGNAVDAIIAVQWALAVVYPRAGNIGGGGFMVYRPNDGNCTTLDFRETAPMAANADLFQDSLGNVIAGLSLDTRLASGVPGTVRGLFEAHSKFGSLPMDVLIKPAIVLAKNGFAITEREAAALNQYAEDIRLRNRFETSFTKQIPWQDGDTLKQKELAETLIRISTNGDTEFYVGTTAQMLIDEMRAGNGIISGDDLKAYKAIWRKPVQASFREFTAYSMPPPSSGGIALGQLLGLSELYMADSIAHNGTGYMHLVTEMERRVYADRAEHLGDPDFYTIPDSLLLDAGYLKSRFKDYNPSRATPSREVKAGKVQVFESMETTHISVVDESGNAASVTTTLNGNYGSKIVVKGAGFLLNNEMDDFSSKPGTPNMFGLVGGEANAIAPGKRMLSSMTPTILEKDGTLFLVVGSPGGSTIITSVFQTIMNAAFFKMNLGDAVAAAKFHSQWLPDILYLEAGGFDHQEQALKSMGHECSPIPSLGRMDAILVNPDGSLQSVGDPRADDHAAGYKTKR